MYNILLKMKTKFEYEQWLKMVNQAKTRGKLTDEEYKKGVTLTLRTFRDALTGLGVEPIEALGKPFDPEKHSAVQQLEAEGAESGTVTMELQRGYTLNGRVVRHAMVAVAP